MHTHFLDDISWEQAWLMGALRLLASQNFITLQQNKISEHSDQIWNLIQLTFQITHLSTAPAVAMETSSFIYKTDVTLIEAAYNNESMKHLVQN